MKTDFNEIEKKLLKEAENFGESGALLVKHKGETVIKTCFGLANRETGEKINEKSRYLMPIDCPSMLALCVFVLIDAGKIRLSDKISRFVPEFEHAGKISIRNLLAGKSGIRDFYFGEILRKLSDDEEYSSLPAIERRKKDMSIYLHDYSFETVLKLIEGKELEHEPGTSGDYCCSERIFLREIVERASGIFLEEFVDRYIFQKLGMDESRIGIAYGANPLYTLFRDKEYLRFDLENTDYRFFTTTLNDLEKLMLGIFEHRLFPEKLWKAATKTDDENRGLGFSSMGGFKLFYFEFECFETATFYFDKENDFCFLRASSSDSKYVMEGDNKSLSFPKALRMEMEPLFTYPKDTVMLPYGEKNWRQACSIEIREDQREFVSGALDTIAYAAAHKNHKLFVEMEGERAVGLLELSIDKKKGDYNIETVIIDRRYQGRGFGRFMLRFAVDYLKKAGAKRLCIGVNRFNIPAQRLYKSVGFKEDCVYEEGIFMSQNLE
ncbi:MAG: GNAT family N-acetyltransferase [Oscillospiraceae bacterium]|nr:GNAT family N-acetyltransferase [Oscillospiraceae bacterium]